jgi:hypothetical protein
VGKIIEIRMTWVLVTRRTARKLPSIPSVSRSLPLTDPVTLRDGRVLRTLGDAAELLTNLHETIQGRAWNQSTAEMLVTAAEAGTDETIESATMQMQRALKRDGLM